MELTEGLPVEIYWNFHKKCYSVRYKGRVIAHTPIFFLTNVRFSVGQAGNRKVREEKRKNVHAFIRGNWTEKAGQGGVVRKVTYNPFQHESFMSCGLNGQPVAPVYAAQSATGTNFNSSAQVHARF